MAQKSRSFKMWLKNFFNSFFSSHKSIFALSLTIFILLESLVLIGVYYTKKSDVTNYLNVVSKNTQIYTKMARLYLSDKSHIFFDTKVANNSKIMQIMYDASHTEDKQKRSKLRKELFSMLESDYEYFRKNGVRQFHFHLPHNISFLRFHRPSKFGDSLVGIRESIDYVNEHRVPISCFEEGRIFNGFRSVFPLYKNDDFVGTVEISYSFLALQKELLKMDATSYLFLEDKNVVGKKVFKSEKFRYEKSTFKNYDYDRVTLKDNMQFRLKTLFFINKQVAPKLTKKLKEGKLFSIPFSNDAVLGGRNLIITFIPVENLDAKVVAYIINYRFDDLFIVNKIKILFIILTIIAFLMSLIAWMFFVNQKHKQDLIEDKAIHDALTSSYNRYGTNKILEYRLSEFQRYNTKFSLIFFDIDHFKNVNDTYGHDVGDYVLKEIISIVQKHIRSSDSVGRWGGEEFIIILPQTPLQEAVHIAEKLRGIIELHPFDKVGQVTCSFGVTEVQEHDEKDSLMKRVDILMYDAKESGRNRVVSQSSSEK